MSDLELNSWNKILKYYKKQLAIINKESKSESSSLKVSKNQIDDILETIFTAKCNIAILKDISLPAPKSQIEEKIQKRIIEAPLVKKELEEIANRMRENQKK